MAVKVIALDMDGTLLNSEKEVSPYTKEILWKAAKKGCRIVLASGRALAGMLPTAEKIQLQEMQGFIIAYNGSVIFDCKDKRIMYQKQLPSSEIGQIHGTAKTHGTTVITYRGGNVVTDSPEDTYVQLECRMNGMQADVVADFVKEVTFPVPKCLIVGEHERLLAVQKALLELQNPNIMVYFSTPYFLDVLTAGVDKASSLEWLLQKLGYHKMQLMCCGDGTNDISMLQAAGIGVAMENATEDIKEIADVITGSNDEDGVAFAIKRYVLHE